MPVERVVGVGDRRGREAADSVDDPARALGDAFPQRVDSPREVRSTARPDTADVGLTTADRDDAVAPAGELGDKGLPERAPGAADQRNVPTSCDRLAAVYLGQELLPERRVGEGAAPERGHRRRVLFDAAHPRAQVGCLEVDGDAGRRDQLDQGVRNLLAEALLDREALAEEPDEPRQLRDADDLVPGDVADVRDAVEGQSMVLAERVERDRPLDDLAQRLRASPPSPRRGTPSGASGRLRSPTSSRRGRGAGAAACRASPAYRARGRGPRGSRRGSPRSAASPCGRSAAPALPVRGGRASRATAPPRPRPPGFRCLPRFHASLVVALRTVEALVTQRRRDLPLTRARRCAGQARGRDR